MGSLDELYVTVSSRKAECFNPNRETMSVTLAFSVAIWGRRRNNLSELFGGKCLMFLIR